MFVSPRHIEGLKKLVNFSFQRHKEHNIDEKLLLEAERFISERSKVILEFTKQMQKW